VTPTIQWQGNDVDNDIKEYEILLDTNTPPMASNGIEGSDISEKVLSGLSAGTKYYWQIVTTDEFGNSTKSEIIGSILILWTECLFLIYLLVCLY